MNNKQIIIKAIEKAVGNGWKPEFTAKELIDEVTLTADAESLVFCMIFSHDFAKAFWGEEIIRWGTSFHGIELTASEPEWEFHLKRMVSEKDPIKYLKKFL